MLATVFPVAAVIEDGTCGANAQSKQRGVLNIEENSLVVETEGPIRSIAASGLSLPGRGDRADERGVGCLALAPRVLSTRAASAASEGLFSGETRKSFAKRRASGKD
jgi:hypothetical protein